MDTVDDDRHPVYETVDWAYDTLELSRGVPLEEVRRAYRDLVMMWHPDRVPPTNSRLQQKANEKTKALHVAYNIISDYLKVLGQITEAVATDRMLVAQFGRGIPALNEWFVDEFFRNLRPLQPGGGKEWRKAVEASLVALVRRYEQTITQGARMSIQHTAIPVPLPPFDTRTNDLLWPSTSAQYAKYLGAALGAALGAIGAPGLAAIGARVGWTVASEVFDQPGEVSIEELRTKVLDIANQLGAKAEIYCRYVDAYLEWCYQCAEATLRSQYPRNA